MHPVTLRTWIGIVWQGWNRPQEFVYGTEISLRHFAVDRPWHHLQDLPSGIVRIMSGAHSLDELGKRQASRIPAPVGR